MWGWIVEQPLDRTDELLGEHALVVSLAELHRRVVLERADPHERVVDTKPGQLK